MSSEESIPDIGDRLAEAIDKLSDTLTVQMEIMEGMRMALEDSNQLRAKHIATIEAVEAARAAGRAQSPQGAAQPPQQAQGGNRTRSEGSGGHGKREKTRSAYCGCDCQCNKKYDAEYQGCGCNCDIKAKDGETWVACGCQIKPGETMVKDGIYWAWRPSSTAAGGSQPAAPAASALPFR